LNIAPENVSAEFVPGAVSSDDPDLVNDPTRWRGILANDDTVADCDNLTTKALTPRLDLQEGQVTIARGGQYHEFSPCCFCPCDTSPDFRDLVPCKISSIIVDATIDVADNGDPSRCDSQVVTLTLSDSPGRNMYYDEVVGDQFTTVGFLNCVSGKLNVVVAFNSVSCSSLLPEGAVVLDSISASPQFETCCPIGRTVKFGDPADVEVTIAVTTVVA
jgi:hypothetical protein